jgi:hypothetical protein
MSSAVPRRLSQATVLLVVLALLMPLLVFSAPTPAQANTCDATATPYGGGGGTTSNPYLICAAGHIAHLAATSGDWGEHFLQQANIVLPLPAPGQSNHTRIGSGFSSAFTGTYDGGGYTISGMILEAPTVNGLGFFGFTDGATLIDIHLISVSVNGRDWVGGLAGDTKDTVIKNSSVSGAIVGKMSVGGLVGFSSINFGTSGQSLIENSFATADVTSTDQFFSQAGGLAGWASDGTIIDSYATGSVQGVEAIGGLVGYASNQTITSSFATGSVTATGDIVGGLVGEAFDGAVLDSYATGRVEGRDSVGGIAGNARGSANIVRSSAQGDVEGRNDVGGLIGKGESAAMLAASYAEGDVTGTGDRVGGLAGSYAGQLEDAYALGDVQGNNEVGGLVGYVDGGSVDKAYAAGMVTATGTGSDVGGLIGKADGMALSVSASLFDTGTTSQAASAGGQGVVGLSSADMTTFGTFSTANWRIVAGSSGGQVDVWGMCSAVNDGYPFLLWQAASSASDPCVVPTVTPPPATAPGATSGGDEADSGVSEPAFMAPGGVLPALAPGAGQWVFDNGATVSLAVSLVGDNQLEYAADGLSLTLTGQAGSSVERGLVVDPQGEIECTLCAAFTPGSPVFVWLFSTPRLLGDLVVGELCETFTLSLANPADGAGAVTAGSHTLQLAVADADGMQALNVGVTVAGGEGAQTGLVPTGVPAGEGPVFPVGLWLMGVVLISGVLLAARRYVLAG